MMTDKQIYDQQRFRAKSLRLAALGLTVRGTARKNRLRLSLEECRAVNLKKWNARVARLSASGLTTRGTVRRPGYDFHGKKIAFAVLRRAAVAQSERMKAEATARAFRVIEQFSRAA